MKKNSLAVLLLTLFAACAPLGKYNQVTTVREDLYGRGVELAGTSDNLASLSWSEVFTDPYLQDLIQKALDNNPDLMMAREHVQQAEAALLGAKLQYVPSLSLSPFVLGQFTQGGASSFSYNLVGDASWEIDIFGRIANNVKSAKASLAQQEDYRQAVRVNLISNVADTYYALLMLDAQLLASLEMEKTWEKSVQTIDALKQEGYGDQVGVSQYQANYAKTKLTTLDLQNKIVQTENAMSMLLGVPPGRIERGNLADQALPDNLAVGIPVQMLTLRPDVRAAQLQMETAFCTTKAAWLNFFPRLSIAGTSSGLVGTIGQIEPLSAIANLSANLVAPIFNAGKNRSTLKAAESMQREAGMMFDNTLLKAGTEVNNALMDYNNCTAKMDWYEVEVSNLLQARQDTETLIRNSEGKTYLDVLTANNALIDALFEMIANKTARMQAVVSLYAALGGGSEY